MHYIVEDIEFDFEDSQGTIDKEEQKFITENTIGLWYVDTEFLDPEEALIEKITDKTGWCIKSIKYCENRPHPFNIVQVMAFFITTFAIAILSYTLFILKIYNPH